MNPRQTSSSFIRFAWIGVLAFLIACVPADAPSEEAPLSAPVQVQPEPTPIPPSPTPTPFEPSEPEPAPDSPGQIVFLETFDGEPNRPLVWDDELWDVTVHRRDVLFESAPFWADHTAECGAPPLGGPEAPMPDESNAHLVSDFDEHVYQCRNHVMTTLYGTAVEGVGYGAIYLTPHLVVDVSQDFVIEWEISTMRTTTRDWFDVWVTRYDDNLMHPVRDSLVPDLQGEPHNGFVVESHYVDGIEMLRFASFTDETTDYPINDYESWNDILVANGTAPDRAERTTFRIERSNGRFRVGMPLYDVWWYDIEAPADFEQIGEAVVQFGHHSYVPDKDCEYAKLPWSDRCGANTYHWDNMLIEGEIREINAIRPVERDPAVTIVESIEDGEDGVSGVLQLEAPVPADAMLRFSGLGNEIKVRFDDGPWVDGVKQANLFDIFVEERFQAYWMPIPEGTQTIEFTGRSGDWFGPWAVRDPAVWALEESVDLTQDQFFTPAAFAFQSFPAEAYCRIET